MSFTLQLYVHLKSTKQYDSLFPPYTALSDLMKAWKSVSSKLKPERDGTHWGRHCFTQVRVGQEIREWELNNEASKGWLFLLRQQAICGDLCAPPCTEHTYEEILRRSFISIVSGFICIVRAGSILLKQLNIKPPNLCERNNWRHAIFFPLKTFQSIIHFF